jgi:GNAT superfamily N-acetyltransferase
MGHADSGGAQSGEGVQIRPWDEAYQGLLADRPGPPEAHEGARFPRPSSGSPPGQEQVLVAFADERMVGFTLARTSSDEDSQAGEAEVAALYVEPDVRGKGIGDALLRALLQRLSRTELTTATVWLPAEAARIRRFYEARDWAADTAERVRPGGGAVELRYRIAL